MQVHIMKSHVQSTIEDLSAELGRPVSLWLMDTQGLEGTHWLTLRQDMTHNNRCTHRWVNILSNFNFLCVTPSSVSPTNTHPPISRPEPQF